MSVDIYVQLLKNGSECAEKKYKLTMMGYETVNQNSNSRCSSFLQVAIAIY